MFQFKQHQKFTWNSFWGSVECSDSSQV